MGVIILVPAAIIVVLAFVEGFWVFAQNRDVGSAADLGARMAAENFGTVGQVSQETCNGMDIVYPATHPVITLRPEGGEGKAGDFGTITVVSEFHTLTGFLDPMFRNSRLKASADFRLETPPDGEALWWNSGAGGQHRCS